MSKEQTKYGITVSVSLPFHEAVQHVKDVFKEEGFGTLTEIDVQKTLREKIGQEIEPYSILGMCNPNLASRAIAAEPQIGLMLPCNVLVTEQGGSVQVSAQDPILMMRMTENPALTPIAEEARMRIGRALERLN